MKSHRQFLALFRYHAFASPWIWIFPLSFGSQSFIALMAGASWRSLSAPLSSVGMLIFVPMMIAAFVFAVEKVFVGTPGLTAQTHQQIQTYAGDFLLTRAIDRPVLFRARTALYWMLILVPLLALIVMTMWRPELSIEVPLKAPTNAEFYLAQLPGAEVTKTTKSTQVITSPQGRVILAGAIALLGIGAAAFWQVVLYLILPFRFRKWIFWGLFTLGVFAAPLLMIFSPRNEIGHFELLVLWMMHHAVPCLSVVALLVVVGYFFCAARDREMEYP